MSSFFEAWQEEQEEAEAAAWAASPEGQKAIQEDKRRREKYRLDQERAAAERVRRERVWKTKYKHEFAEWNRIRPLLKPDIDFGAEKEFDFEGFLTEVGRDLSKTARVVRRDRKLPFKQGNIEWGRPKATKKAKSPNLNSREAAAFLGIELQTLYNNRPHIPSLPGFKRLQFDPKVLAELRSSVKFKNMRLAAQRKPRAKKARS